MLGLETPVSNRGSPEYRNRVELGPVACDESVYPRSCHTRCNCANNASSLMQVATHTHFRSETLARAWQAMDRTGSLSRTARHRCICALLTRGRCMRLCLASLIFPALTSAAGTASTSAASLVSSSVGSNLQHRGQAHARSLLYAATDVAPLDGADMRCRGDGVTSRACLIRDLYYDTDTRAFQFYGTRINTAKAEKDIKKRERTFYNETCVSSMPLTADVHHV